MHKNSIRRRLVHATKNCYLEKHKIITILLQTC